MPNDSTTKNTGFKKSPPPSAIPKGKNYLLSIGIDKYNDLPQLYNAVKDAKEVVEILLNKPDPLIQKAQLTVYDLYGRRVFQDSNVGYGEKYRIGKDWNLGVYFIHVKAGAFENKIKVVKGN